MCVILLLRFALVIMSRVAPGQFCYLDEKMCRDDNVFVVVFYLELIRLQVVSAFKSPVVTVILIGRGKSGSSQYM